jgi:hypothetical protein
MLEGRFRVRKFDFLRSSNTVLNAVGILAKLAVIVAIISPLTRVAGQQITGELGSPSATTTVDGKQLPAPPPKFTVVIHAK